MRIATVKVKGLSPLQYSKFHNEEMLEKEGHQDYEQRTWKSRAHVDKDGHLFFPPMAFKRGLDDAASRLGMKIKGKNRQTYTKHFLSGVVVVEPLRFAQRENDLRRLDLFVPSNGKKGAGSRVMKSFPILDEWEGEITFHILDDVITEQVFDKHVQEFASFIGIGAFRPQNGGYFGRMSIENIEWVNQA